MIAPTILDLEIDEPRVRTRKKKTKNSRKVVFRKIMCF